MPFSNADNLIVTIEIPVFVPPPRWPPSPTQLYDTVFLYEYLAGEIKETSKREILDRVKYLKKLD